VKSTVIGALPCGAVAAALGARASAGKVCDNAYTELARQH
jgi:hypothetical protein